MPVISEIRDYSDELGNEIIGVPAKCINSHIHFTSENCRVEIAPGVSFQNCNIHMSADYGLVRIGESASVKRYMRVGHRGSVIIGARLSSTGGGVFAAAEGTTIAVGDDCMFAVSFDIRSDHAHPIFDRRTGKRINKSKSLEIGNHVWLGPNVLVYPGANIGEGSVIGARSLVSGSIPPNCVAVGVPARVTQRDIVWDKRHVAISRPWLFDDISAIPNPWESQFPLGDERSDDLPRASRNWLQKMLSITGCMVVFIAAQSGSLDQLAAF